MASKVPELLRGFEDVDPDLRYMALSDLANVFRTSYTGVGSTEDKNYDLALEKTTHLLINDSNTDVRNEANKTLGVLIRKPQAAPRIQQTTLKLAGYLADKDDSKRDVAGMALKTIIDGTAVDSPSATQICQTLCPKLYDVGSQQANPDRLLTTSDILLNVLSRFAFTMRSLTQLQSSAVAALIFLLGNTREAIRKNAVSAFGRLGAIATDDVFADIVARAVVPLAKSGKATSVGVAAQLVGALAENSPRRVGSVLENFVPSILSTSGFEDDEVKETGMQTFEVLLNLCRTEVTPFVAEIVSAATELIKYDPNYADFEDEEDEEMADGDDEDDDDLVDDFPDDDDDVSWKVRRAAARVLSAAILTRPELLSDFYRTIAPVLVSRLSEREESVKVDVWTAFENLLEQTKTQAKGFGSDQTAGTKRKRESGEMEAITGPHEALQAVVPAAVPTIIKQLNTKDVRVGQAGFSLLDKLIEVLNGGLEPYAGVLFSKVDVLLAAESGAGAVPKLKIAILAFLSHFFETHNVSSYQNELDAVIPLLTVKVITKFPATAPQVYAACSSLIRALRPLPARNASVPPLSSKLQGYVTAVYDAIISRPIPASADVEIKTGAIRVIGVLIAHAGDVLAKDFGRSLPLLTDRLRNEITRAVTMSVIADIADSPTPSGPEFEAWLQSCLKEVASLLRKRDRTLRTSAFKCLDALIRRSGSTLPAESSNALVHDIAPVLSEADGYFLSRALATVSQLMVANRSVVTLIGSTILPTVFALIAAEGDVRSTASASSTELVRFFETFVASGADATTIVDKLSKTPTSLSSKCLGAVAKGNPAAGTRAIATLQNEMQRGDARNRKFDLEALGAIGRSIDFAQHEATFAAIQLFYNDKSDEIKRAAAAATGDIASGNPNLYIPLIVVNFGVDEKRMYLHLTAIKQAIEATPADKLSQVSDLIWAPLFAYNEKKDFESRSSVPAECFAKLTITNPDKYLGQVYECTKSPSANTRATFTEAARSCLVNLPPQHDQAVATLIGEFQRLSVDNELLIRSLALSLVNSAARHRPHLIRTTLNKILPRVYEMMVVDESLFHEVSMGPFKTKVDRGRDMRVAAYGCLNTLLDSQFDLIDIYQVIDKVIDGLNTDAESEVKIWCYHLLRGLIERAPRALSQKLDGIAPSFRKTLTEKPNTNALKQEVDSTVELQRSTLRTLALLSKMPLSGSVPVFQQLVDFVSASQEWRTQFEHLLAQEDRTSRAAGSAMQID